MRLRSQHSTIVSQQPRVCPPCRAYSHTAKRCVPHSTHSIASLAAAPSVVVLQHLNLLVYCQKGWFLLYLEAHSSSSSFLIYLSIRKPHWGVLQRQKPPGKEHCQPLSEKAVQTPQWSFGQQLLVPNLFLHPFECDPHRDTLYIYTAQVVFFAVGIYGANSINAFFPALFITHYCQAPYLSLLKGRGALQCDSGVAALGMLE